MSNGHDVLPEFDLDLPSIYHEPNKAPAAHEKVAGPAYAKHSRVHFP